MPLQFYADEHLHGAIVRGLRRRGIDILAAVEDGRSGYPDDEIVERATTLNRLVVTHDKDYLKIAAELESQGMEYSGIVYLTPDGVTIRTAILDLELIALAGDASEFRNRVNFLPY